MSASWWVLSCDPLSPPIGQNAMTHIKTFQMVEISLRGRGPFTVFAPSPEALEAEAETKVTNENQIQFCVLAAGLHISSVATCCLVLSLAKRLVVDSLLSIKIPTFPNIVVSHAAIVFVSKCFSLFCFCGKWMTSQKQLGLDWFATMLRSHIVMCHTLLPADLSRPRNLTSLSGHVLTTSYSQVRRKHSNILNPQKLE